MEDESLQDVSLKIKAIAVMSVVFVFVCTLMIANKIFKENEVDLTLEYIQESEKSLESCIFEIKGLNNKEYNLEVVSKEYINGVLNVEQVVANYKVARVEDNLSVIFKDEDENINIIIENTNNGAVANNIFFKNEDIDEKRIIMISKQELELNKSRDVVAYNGDIESGKELVFSLTLSKNVD